MSYTRFVNEITIIKELQFKAIRSSGAGGQHVNKVATKIVLSFDLLNSESLTDTEKERLQIKLANRLTQDGIIQMTCDESRSQSKNKVLVTQRFIDLLVESLKRPKKRKPTNPTKASKLRRKSAKQKQSQKKSDRKRPRLE